MKLEGIQVANAYTVHSSNSGQGSQSERLQQFKQNAADKVKSVSELKAQTTEEEIKKTLEKANKSFQPFDRKFDISVHEETNTIMVKVIDARNDEVIREIPPEKILDMIANMQELAGLLIDHRV